MATKDFNTATLRAQLVQLELTTSEATMYTVPASSCFKIQSFSLCNRHTSSVSAINVSVIPSGATAAAQHRLVSGLTIAAGDTVSLEAYFEGMMLGEGDFIKVKAGSASLVSAFMTGVVGT